MADVTLQLESNEIVRWSGDALVTEKRFESVNGEKAKFHQVWTNSDVHCDFTSARVAYLTAGTHLIADEDLNRAIAQAVVDDPESTSGRPPSQVRLDRVLAVHMVYRRETYVRYGAISILFVDGTDTPVLLSFRIYPLRYVNGLPPGAVETLAQTVAWDSATLQAHIKGVKDPSQLIRETRTGKDRSWNLAH